MLGKAYCGKGSREPSRLASRIGQHGAMQCGECSSLCWVGPEGDLDWMAAPPSHQRDERAEGTALTQGAVAGH